MGNKLSCTSQGRMTSFKGEIRVRIKVIKEGAGSNLLGTKLAWMAWK